MDGPGAGFGGDSRIMPFARPAGVGLTMLVVVASATAVRGQDRPAAATRLDPDMVSIRLLLGVGDREARPWDGRVRIDRGEVLGVEGHRFHEGDRATGRDTWAARAHTVRRFAARVPGGRAVSTGTAGPIVEA